MSMLIFLSGSTRFPELAYSYFYSVKLIEWVAPEVSSLGEMSLTYQVNVLDAAPKLNGISTLEPSEESYAIPSVPVFLY